MPDRRCKHIFAMLSDYLNADFPVKNCRELETHLKGCQPCIAYLESLKNTVEACHHYASAQDPALKESAGSSGSSVSSIIRSPDQDFFNACYGPMGMGA